MDTSTQRARVFRDGQLICDDAEVTLRHQPEVVVVPLTGNRDGYKDLGHSLSTIARFGGWLDPNFEDELREVVRGANDLDLRRRQRDAQWGPQLIDLQLADGTNLAKCRISNPSSGSADVLAIDFQLHHPDL
jgi:hypothetical protein